MPDDLHRAVRAELDAHEPGPAPSFDSILDRKRTRDRKRGGAALAATALAVTGGVFVPSVLTSPGPAPDQVAAGDTAYSTFVIRYADQAGFGRSGDAVQDCLKDPSVVRSHAAFSAPPVLSGLLRGDGAPGRLSRCVAENAPGATVETAPADQKGTPLLSPYTVSADGLTLTVTAEVGGGCEDTGTATATADETDDRVEVTALVARHPIRTGERGSGPFCPSDLVTQQVQVRLDAPLGDRDVFDVATGREVTADPKGGPPAADSTRYGVGVGWGDDPASYDDDAEAAVQRCFSETGLEELSTLTKLPPAHSGKITGKAAADALKACVAKGAPSATVFLTPLPTPVQQAFIEKCLGPDYRTALPAPGVAGLTEAEANPPDSLNPEPPRVVGRDGECLGRTRDLRESRVNVIVENGTVVWAGRF